MNKTSQPRLRFFAQSSGQRHIAAHDRFLYRTPAAKYRIAIIGTGTIGQEHMRVATLLGRAQVHGIFDIERHSMDAAEAEFRSYSDQPLVRYASLEEACNDPDVEALFICTPNYTHYDVLKVAAQSGKPLFVEKPMATTLADAADIVRMAASYGSFMQIGLQYRYKAQYVEAFHEALQRRSLGAVKTISMSEYRPPFLDKVKQWNKFNEFSGGTLVEKCCHYFDLINLMAQSEPARVYASGGQAVNFRNFERDGKTSDIDDHAFVVIDYQNGVRANFTLNMFCPDFVEELVVSGEYGRLIANEEYNFHAQLATKTTLKLELGENGASRTTALGYPRVIEQSGHHGATYFEHEAFVDQLEGKSADCATPVQGLWAMVVACAAQQSMRTGAAVNIEEFILQEKLSAVLGR
jgi:myo-inositol 2-dehydrogenase / D-chiro-inositol 1-dehydrogenase